MSEHRSTDKGPLLADEARQLYLRLLDSQVPPSVAECPTDGLGQLLDLGLAKVEDEGVLVVAPGQALANLTGVLQVRTRQTLSELAEVSEFLGSCVSSPASDLQVDGSRPVPVRVITNREELLRYNSRLPSVARRSYCSVQTSARLARGYQLAGLPAADPVSYSGAVCRIIVDQASAEDARAVIAAGIKRGEQIRCHPAPPLKFIVVDNQLTVLPLDESGRSGAVVLSSPAIGSLLAWTFEHLWKQAEPLPGSRAGPAELHPADLRILRMLADDATDTAIASTLGMSERSLRRHIATLAESLGVRSRQGAIAAAFRLGLLV